jgi:ABC-type Mn2+/Zn2+ transport system ATPase subunit
MNFETIQEQIDQLNKQAFSAKQALIQERKAYNKAKHYYLDVKAVWVKAQIIAKTIQQHAHAQIAGVVTSFLHMVFTDDVYDFEIRSQNKRGKAEAHLILIKNGKVIENPVDEDSGGVINVAAFVLRIACIAATKPRLRRFVAMDEPFHHVSKKYRPAVKNMILQLSKQFNVQFLISTHIKELMIGKVIEL